MNNKPKVRRGAIRDLAGQKFGKLTVVEFVKLERRNPKGKPYTKALWRCKCECGNETTVRGSSLTSGTTTSCGCVRKEQLSKKRKDLTGQKFGKLSVIKYKGPDSVSRSPMYEVKCDCGNTKTVRGSNLTSGRTKSCGRCR